MKESTPVVVSVIVPPGKDRDGDRQTRFDCDTHAVDSQAVMPNRPPTLPSPLPIPDPTTVTIVPPVDAALLLTTLLTVAMSYVNMSAAPRHNRADTVEVLATRPLSEIHWVISVWVTGNVVVKLASARPKLEPRTVTLVDPVAAPLVCFVEDRLAKL